jgi:hypothetical protein
MMKNRIFFLLGMNAVVLLLIGCGSSPAPVQANAVRTLPAFVSNPPADAYMIFGIGGVKKANARQAIQIADGRARQDITEQLSFIVQGMIAAYSRKTGLEGSRAVSEFQKAVNRHLLDAGLMDTHLIKREPAKDGTLYSLFVLRKEDALNHTVNILNNEAARFSEFTGVDFFEEMAEYLFEARTKPAVIMK